MIFILTAIALMSSIFPFASTSYWDQMLKCPSGTYPECPQQQIFGSSSTPSTSSPMPTCKSCPIGTSSYGDETYSTIYINNNFGGCMVCSNGFTNQTGMAFCQRCPEGYHCLNPSKPEPCQKGFFRSIELSSLSNNQPCQPCPLNTYANKIGSSKCEPCPPGFSCIDPANSPVPCPKGTSTDIYQPSYMGTYNGNPTCQQCPYGFYTSSSGSSMCSLCPEGSFCPDTTRVYKCPNGTYRNFLPYQFWSSGQMIQLPMEPLFCVRCRRGTYMTSSGALACTKCPKGSYCSDPTIAPKKCPLGTFSNSEAGQSQCTQCPDGYYANVIGSTKCNRCPDGYQCQDQTLAPKKCPLGMFSNSTMIKVTCQRCQPGTFANATGMTFCYKCPDSMCCDDPASNPTSCPIPIVSSTPIYTTSF